MKIGANLKHDLMGRVFGLLTVTGRDFSRPGRVAWSTQCQCGNHKSVLSHNLLSGDTQHCGCVRKNRTLRSKYEGTRHGKLVALKYFTDGKKMLIEVRCDCGAVKVISYSNFVSKRTKSCGCLAHYSPIKHGDSDSITYKYWIHFKRRLLSEGSLPEEWSEYSGFLKDVGARPSKSHRLEKKSSNQPFSKENFQWTTERIRSGRNPKHLLKVGDKLLSIHEVAKLTGKTRWGIQLRLLSGRSVEEILSQERLTNRGKRILREEKKRALKLCEESGMSYLALRRKMITYDLSPEEALVFSKRERYLVDGESLLMSEILRKYSISKDSFKYHLQKGKSAQEIVDRKRDGHMKRGRLKGSTSAVAR